MDVGNLIITRRPKEAFKIGPNVTITVVSVDRNKVKLSIKAPQDVRISRTEIIPEETNDSPAS